MFHKKPSKGSMIPLLPHECCGKDVEHAKMMMPPHPARLLPEPKQPFHATKANIAKKSVRRY